MEDTAKRFVVVRIGGRVLSTPVELHPDRHGVEGPGPNAAKLDDDAAVRILTDAILENRALADEFADAIREIGRREASA
jgi:hypothetical protein